MKHNSAGHGNGTRQGLWPRVNDLYSHIKERPKMIYCSNTTAIQVRAILHSRIPHVMPSSSATSTLAT